MSNVEVATWNDSCFIAIERPGSALPQVLQPEFKVRQPAVKAGKKDELTVSFNLLKGYAINHKPPISLKLTQTPGVTLRKTDFTTPAEDPKSKDEYYVDLPTFKVPVTVAKAGKYEIPGKADLFLLFEDGRVLLPAGPRRQNSDNSRQ